MKDISFFVSAHQACIWKPTSITADPGLQAKKRFMHLLPCLESDSEVCAQQILELQGSEIDESVAISCVTPSV